MRLLYIAMFLLIGGAGCAKTSVGLSTEELNYLAETETERTTIRTGGGNPYLEPTESFLPEPCLCRWEVVETESSTCLQFVCPDDCDTICSQRIVCTWH